MDRLTNRNKQMPTPIDEHSRYYARCVNCLAEYEDTGLTPEEIAALKADNERLHRLVDTAQNLLRGNTETKEEK